MGAKRSLGLLVGQVQYSRGQLDIVYATHDHSSHEHRSKKRVEATGTKSYDAFSDAEESTGNIGPT